MLASASPRRQGLLKDAGIEFAIRPADILEIPLPAEVPRAFAERMAREKAHAARRSDDEIILSADTVVAIADEILGKPEDARDAIRMLRRLSNQQHFVITAVCLLGKGYEDVRSETTAVEFSAISHLEVEEYVATGEPMDKAGAYAIQGGAAKWVARVEGDYYNVVGLPLELVKKMLREHAVI